MKNLTLENGKLQSNINNNKTEIERLNNEKEVLRNLVDKSKQPYSYLIKRIEDERGRNVLLIESMRLK